MKHLNTLKNYKSITIIDTQTLYNQHSKTKREFKEEGLTEEQADKQWLELHKKLDKEIADNKRNQFYKACLLNNFFIELKEEMLPLIIECVREFNGKKAGNKTREKVSHKLKETFPDYNIYLSTRALNVSHKELYERLELHSAYGKDFIDNDNKYDINMLSECTMYYCSYIDDIDKHIELVQEGWTKIQQAKEELERELKTYGELIHIKGYERPYIATTNFHNPL